MAEAIVEQHFAFLGSHEIVFQVRYISAVVVKLVETVLIGKIIKLENVVSIHGHRRAGMQVRINFNSLNNARNPMDNWFWQRQPRWSIQPRQRGCVQCRLHNASVRLVYIWSRPNVIWPWKRSLPEQRSWLSE